MLIIGLSKHAVDELTAELDLHVASASVLFHQYLKHAWLVQGPPYEACKALFTEHYLELVTQMADLGTRVTVLGGTPRCDPLEQVNVAYLTHEPEGRFSLEAMLRLDLQHEVTMAKRLRESVEAARERLDFGTEHLLKRVLLATETRAHRLSQQLGAQASVGETS